MPSWTQHAALLVITESRKEAPLQKLENKMPCSHHLVLCFSLEYQPISASYCLFPPMVVTFTHHFSCLCWTLMLLLVDIAMTAVIKNSGYVRQPSESKVSVFLQIHSSSSSQSQLSYLSVPRGLLSRTSCLLRVSETMRFHHLWPWSDSLNFFWLLIWITLFSFLGHFFPPHFLGYSTLRGPLFLLFFVFCQEF